MIHNWCSLIRIFVLPVLARAFGPAGMSGSSIDDVMVNIRLGSFIRQIQYTTEEKRHMEV